MINEIKEYMTTGSSQMAGSIDDITVSDEVIEGIYRHFIAEHKEATAISRTAEIVRSIMEVIDEKTYV